MLRTLILAACFLAISASGFAKKTICLNMIVKDESAVIERCLGSLIDLIDYWVIVDTGSTDGTQARIRNFLKNIPGEIHERPWVDFAHNRNEALQLAKSKGDYLLFIDADEVLERSDTFSLPDLELDSYWLAMRELGAADVSRLTLIKSSLDWRWEGVIHETLICKDPATAGWLDGIVNICNLGGGARSKDPLKSYKDAQVLEKLLETEPHNSRYVFYTAQCYLSAGEYTKALKYFEARAEMAGEPEETFLALMNLGICQMYLKMPVETVTASLFNAYRFRPSRAEPLFHAAVYFRQNNFLSLGYETAKLALTIPKPVDRVVVYMIYDYLLLIELANCALLSGRDQEGLEACDRLLANSQLPSEYRPPVAANRLAAIERLKMQSKWRTRFDQNVPH